MMNQKDGVQVAWSINIFDKIITWLISIIFLICPFFVTNLTAQDVGYEKIMLFYGLTLIAAIFWLLKAVVIGELKLIKTPLDIPLAVTLLLMIASTVLSINKKISFMGAYGNPSKGLLAFIMVVIFYYLVVNNLTIQKLKIFYSAFLGSGIIIILTTILQFRKIFILPIPGARDITFNLIGNSTSLANYLIVLMPLLIVGLSQFDEIFPNVKKLFKITAKSVLAITTILSVISLMLLNNFSNWSLAILGILILLIFILSRVITINPKNIIIPSVAFLLFIVLLSMSKFHFGSLQLPDEVSLNHQASWNIAVSTLKSNPIFGTGPSTFDYAFGRYKNQNFNSTPLWNVRFNSANGGLFEMLSTNGSLATLGFIVVLLIILSASFISIIKSKDEKQPILLGLFASFVCVVYVFVMNPINSTMMLVFWLLLALTAAAGSSYASNQIKTRNISLRVSTVYALSLPAIFLATSVGVILIITTGVKMYIADIYVKQATVATDNSIKIEKLSKAINIIPTQEAYLIALSNVYIQEANRLANININDENVARNISAAIQLARSVTDDLSPNNAGANELVASLYENAAAYAPDALKYDADYQNKVLSLEPVNPMPNIRLGLIKMATAKITEDKTQKEANINEAINQYQMAINKKPDFSQAYYYQAVAYDNLKNFNAATDALNKAANYAPKDIEYIFEIGRLYYNLGVEITGSTDTTPITKNDNIKMAEQIFQAILAAQPNHSNSIYSLTLLNNRTGDKESAKKYFSMLMNVLPDGEQKENVKKQFPDLQ